MLQYPGTHRLKRPKIKTEPPTTVRLLKVKSTQRCVGTFTAECNDQECKEEALPEEHVPAACVNLDQNTSGNRIQICSGPTAESYRSEDMGGYIPPFEINLEKKINLGTGPRKLMCNMKQTQNRDTFL
ncbi:hypothetical protein AMECASPLE_010583 [Ameca splendens]|uniref:Uncharacterized protein n=1 Tax=Ameca splendens TaxID=208324 RepID=A0ABV0Y0I9_9TELE